jgi:hypothetical protein
MAFTTLFLDEFPASPGSRIICGGAQSRGEVRHTTIFQVQYRQLTRIKPARGGW